MNKILYDGKTFTNADIISGKTTESCSLRSCALEINTLVVEINSDDTTLPQFVRNSPVQFFHDNILMGTYYVQKIPRISRDIYRFECTSTVGLLSESYHDGGIYTGQTVDEVVQAICNPYPVIVKTNIRDIKLYGWLPIATKRENLSQVLFALGATLKVDYNGTLRVEGLWDGQSTKIDAGHMYAGGSVEYSTPVTQVIVTEHAYTANATETTELFNGTTAAGDKITFDEPCYDLAAEGFSILEAAANYAILSAGSGALTGKKYVHTTRQIVKDVQPAARELVSQSDNIVTVENATLVSLVNANAVADRLVRYYACTERIVNKMVTQRESPGDVVSVYHPYEDAAVQGCIESSDVTVSGKLASTESILVGYTPSDIGEQEYYDTVEVVTQSGAWTVPENVTSIRIVLIGGGQGGASGRKGEDGETGTSSPGDGGAGGLGGDGGSGGKINQVEITVEPGSVHQVSIGTGGTGGAFSGDGNNAGNAGTDTTFDAYTSVDGASSPNGITDPVNQVTYATPGDTGGSGADGGNGGSSSTPNGAGESGQSVGSYAGGAGGEMDYRDSDTYGEGYGCGGGGGGAAMGSNGENGGNGDTDLLSDILGTGPGYLSQGGDGGDGGNATITPEQPSVYGSGGVGGYGGGGGGGVGGAKGKDIWTGAVGAGGNGGPGGAGAPGCILIYYRVYAASSAGRFLTKDGAAFNEVHNRMVVV